MFTIRQSYLAIVGMAFLSAACYGQASGCTANVAAAQINFKNIDEPIAQSTFASGINNSGKIVGDFTDANGVFHGYSDDITGGSFRQIDFPGGTSTLAAGLNDQGEIVGNYTDVNGIGHGFLLRDGNFITVDFPDAISNFASGINDEGIITGSYQTADSSFHGYIFDGNTFTTADDPAEGVLNGTNGPFTISEFLALNNRRQFVGVFFDSNGNLNGFLFYRGSFQTINVPGAVNTIPFGLNDRDIIVGESLDSQLIGHGYVQRGSQITTVDFPGATSTALDQINSAGLIVGEYVDASGLTHSFLTEVPDDGNSGNFSTPETGCAAIGQSPAVIPGMVAPQSCHPNGSKGLILCR